MISIIIDIDDIEISMTADQALRLRDELNRLTGLHATQPFVPIQPGTGEWPNWMTTTDIVTVRQNGLEFKV